MQTGVQTEVRLVQITDFHLLPDPNETLRGFSTEDSFRRVMQRIAARESDTDLLLATGDLVHDAPIETYARLRDYLIAARIRVLCLPGNHDDRSAMARMLPGGSIACLDTIDIADWRIVALDSVMTGHTAGRLGSGELARLDRALAAGSQSHVLVCLHHPPVSTGSPPMDAIGLEDAEEFFTVIDRHSHVRGVLWGHVHQVFDGQRRGVRLMATPSTCFQFDSGIKTVTVSDAPPGYRWIRLSPRGDIETGTVAVNDSAAH